MKIKFNKSELKQIKDAVTKRHEVTFATAILELMDAQQENDKGQTPGELFFWAEHRAFGYDPEYSWGEADIATKNTYDNAAGIFLRSINGQ